MVKLNFLNIGITLLLLSSCRNSTTASSTSAIEMKANSAISLTIRKVSLSLQQKTNSVELSKQLNTYPRYPLELADKIQPGNDFYKFRERLRQAIRKHDAKFIRSIATPNIKLTFGPPKTLDSLDLENPNAPIWQDMERTFSLGCNVSRDQRFATCPTLWDKWRDGKLPPHEYLVVTGKGVNVRAKPSINSSIAGIVSNEAIRVNRDRIVSQNPGWTAVILPNGKQGYILNRFVYSPIGYRAFFGKVKNGWKMNTLIAGD